MAAISKPVQRVGLLALPGRWDQMHATAPLGFCDVNADGVYNIVDAQSVIDSQFGPVVTTPGSDGAGREFLNGVELAIHQRCQFFQGGTVTLRPAFEQAIDALPGSLHISSVYLIPFFLLVERL